jgi:hypothetical protein
MGQIRDPFIRAFPRISSSNARPPRRSCRIARQIVPDATVPAAPTFPVRARKLIPRNDLR